MPYTRRSLALFWLIAFGLFAAVGSASVPQSWLLLPVLVVFVAPFVVLRQRAGEQPAAGQRPPFAASVPGRSLPMSGPTDVSRWENEGGAPRHGGRQVSAPSLAVR